jgi:hypothetical protein
MGKLNLGKSRADYKACARPGGNKGHGYANAPKERAWRQQKMPRLAQISGVLPGNVRFLSAWDFIIEKI